MATVISDDGKYEWDEEKNKRNNESASENIVAKKTHPLLQLAGILSHEEAQEIRSEKMKFSGA